MFETLAQGFLGLTLFFTQLVAPQNERITLSCVRVEKQDAAVVLHFNAGLPIDPQIEKLIDAGVALKVRLSIKPEKERENIVVRTLRHNLGDDTYAFMDSTGGGDIYASKSYPMILLALREFCRFETVVPAYAKSVTAELRVLPGVLASFNRTVDMEKMFGRGAGVVTVNLDKGNRP